LWFSPSFPWLPHQRANDNGSLEERRKQFNRLLADEWDYEMREAPEFATVVGDYRYYDRWRNLSLAHVTQQTEDLKSWQSRFEAVDTADFSEQDKISQQIMVQGLRLRIEGNRLKTFDMPIDQFFGFHLIIAQMVSFSPFDTTKQYEDYLARLGKIPTLFDQIIEVLRQGEKDKAHASSFSVGKNGRAVQIHCCPRGRLQPICAALVTLSGRRARRRSRPPESGDSSCDRSRRASCISKAR